MTSIPTSLSISSQIWTICWVLAVSLEPHSVEYYVRLTLVLGTERSLKEVMIPSWLLLRWLLMTRQKHVQLNFGEQEPNCPIVCYSWLTYHPTRQWNLLSKLIIATLLPCFYAAARALLSLTRVATVPWKFFQVLFSFIFQGSGKSLKRIWCLKALEFRLRGPEFYK